ncbi:hypothetical protein EDB83DRAFT_2526264 [Lactarius deliciosus]|nr:hypothetical protein EDB83DRAFT_2526264 [Lactarius deliciosus]
MSLAIAASSSALSSAFLLLMVFGVFQRGVRGELSGTISAVGHQQDDMLLPELSQLSADAPAGKLCKLDKLAS